MSKLKTFSLICIIIAIIFITYSPVLKNGFTNWDDNILITENLKIREISLRNIYDIFCSYYTGTYIPLTVLSYAIEYNFVKLKSTLYHATNLVLHIFNSLLVFWLIYILSKNILTSFIVAILFGIHPLKVESVAWLTARKDVLYTFFFFISVIMYIFWIKTKLKKYYWLSFISFVLSVFSKPSAVALVIILFLFDYYFKIKFDKQIIIEKIPFFIVSIIFCTINIIAQYSFTKFTPEKIFPISINIFNTSYTIIFYLHKTIFPSKLSCLYPNPEKNNLIYLLSPILVLILILIVIISNKKTNKIMFAFLFYIITLIPVIGFIPLASFTIIADRYTYIPTTGLFYIIGICFTYLFYKKIIYSSLIKPILICCFIIIITVFSVITSIRCRVWYDSITLWTDVLKKYPNISQGYNNRGTAYLDKKEYNKAILDFTKAIRYNKNYAGAYYNRGYAYCMIQQYNNAILDFNTAIKIKPDFVNAYNNRGLVYSVINNYDQAIEDYTRALKLDPNYIKAYYNRAIAYYRKKEYKKSWQDIKKIINSGYKFNSELIKKLQKYSD